MLDVTPFLEVRPAPAAVFDRAQKTPLAPRFHRRTDDGGWDSVNWAQFAERIGAVASFLTSLSDLSDADLAPGARAAIFADNSVEWAAAALGVQTAGAVLVPIYASTPTEQLGYIVEHSDAEVLFVDGSDQLRRVIEAWPMCSAVRTIVLLSEIDWADAHRRADASLRPPIDELEARLRPMPQPLANGVDFAAALARLEGVDLNSEALMLYTSGSTGQPKGVPLTHNNLGLNSRGWLECNRQDLHQQAVDLLWLPMSHIFGFGELCLGNTLGFESTLCSPKQVLDFLPKIRPTVFFSVPAYWEKLAKKAHESGDGDAVSVLRTLTGSRLRFCLSGGAGLKREVKELFYEAGALIIEGYGLTECAPTLTLNSRDAFRFDTVGKPLANLEVRIASDGEIEARGPNVFAGYHKNAEATRAAFTDDGWFRTGDLGRFTDDGFLQIIGRKKEILVTAGGKNVAPANIEIRFADDPGIEHVVIYGDGRKYLVAGVWLAAGVETTNEDIAARIEAVNAQLASYETIKKFCVIDEPLTVEAGLLTPSLKLRRNHIYRVFGPRLDELY